jgi:2-amino-4-hydroxy-6-hydroxymethyldihydropteridine diphosphokinase
MRSSAQPKKGIISHIIRNYVIAGHYSSFPQGCPGYLTIYLTYYIKNDTIQVHQNFITMSSVEMIRLVYLSFSIIGPVALGVCAPKIKNKIKKFIEKAVELLKKENDFINLKISDVIEIEPVGKTDQGKFLNAVCQFETKLDPRAVFQKTKKIEELVGQKAQTEWGNCV